MLTAKAYWPEQVDEFSKHRNKDSRQLWSEQVDDCVVDDCVKPDVSVVSSEPAPDPHRSPSELEPATDLMTGDTSDAGSVSLESSSSSSIGSPTRGKVSPESSCGSTVATLEFEPQSPFYSAQHGSFGESAVRSGNNANQFNGMDCVQLVPFAIIDPQAMWPMIPWTKADSNIAVGQSSSCFSQCPLYPTAAQHCYYPDQPPEIWMDTTTVMMRNLPNKYSQDMLEEEIKQAGYRNDFDWTYLPIDVEKNRNKGYAFINFNDPASAWRFKCYYEGRQMLRFNSAKYVTVVPAALQRDCPKVRARRPNGALPRSSANGQIPAKKKHVRRQPNGSLIDKAFALTQTQQAQLTNEVSMDGKEIGKKSGAHVADEENNPSIASQFCPSCRSEVMPDFKFCIDCGKRLT